MDGLKKIGIKRQEILEAIHVPEDLDLDGLDAIMSWAEAEKATVFVKRRKRLDVRSLVVPVYGFFDPDVHLNKEQIDQHVINPIMGGYMARMESGHFKVLSQEDIDSSDLVVFDI